MKTICKTGCVLYEDYKKCPHNNGDLHGSFSLVGRCKVISEQVEREAQERIKKREIEEKTCPDCGSTNSVIVRSIPQGEIIYGERNYYNHIRQCKKCKTVW